jgi:hypothetical protein
MTTYNRGWPITSSCSKSATTEHDGKPYCKTHNPALRKARNDAAHQAWLTAQNSKYAKQKSDAQKIVAHDDLLAALQSIANDASNIGSAYIIARAAIAKATS